MERGGEIFELLGVDVRVVGRIDKEKTLRPGVCLSTFSAVLPNAWANP